MAARANPWSMKGRLAPRTYWRSVATILVIRFAVTLALTYRPTWDFLRHTDVLLFVLAVVIGKRMKDFGVGPYWAWLAVFVISFVLPIIAVMNWPQPYDPDHPLSALSGLAGVASMVLLLALIVAVGLRKGDNGENRFGPVQA